MHRNIPAIETEICVFDYETTGTIPGYKNEPWQIGIVSLKNGKLDPSSSFESLLHVDQKRPFNPHAPGRHNLIREAIASAPNMHEIWPQIAPRLLNQPLCAHNIATEKKITRQAAPMHRFGPWIDTLKIARKVWPKAKSYALEDLTDYLSLTQRLQTYFPDRQAHDALYDAFASALMLEHLLEQPGWDRITISELAGL